MKQQAVGRSAWQRALVVASLFGSMTVATTAHGEASQALPADPGGVIVDDHDMLVNAADADLARDPAPSTQMAGIIPVTPGRLLDTRIGIGSSARPVHENSSIDVAVLGKFGVPASGVDAVVLNVTVVRPTATSYVTIWPTGAARPETSNLNMRPGLTIPNLVVAKVGDGGMVSLFNRFGSTDLLADVVGYSTSTEHLQSLVPARIFDTRTGVGAPVGKVPENSSFDVSVLGRGGVPTSGVGSVIVNITSTQPTAKSYVTVWPTGSERPEASSLNLVVGEKRPNLVIAKVGVGGRISLFNRFGSTHLFGDVVGWMPEHGAYTSINPTRILDTRSGLGTYGTWIYDKFLDVEILRPGSFDGPVGQGKTISVAVPSEADIPSGATALVLNVTAVGATKSTYITAWPQGVPMPTASSINATPGANAPNMVVVERGDRFGGFREKYFNLYNNSGGVHLIADIVGYYVPWNAQDAPDATTDTVHIVVATPLNVPSTIGDADALHTVAAAEQWLQTQAGRGLRFDTDRGAIEVSRLTFGATRQQLEPAADPYHDAVFDEVAAGGFGDTEKKYLVFVEGVDSTTLGIADNPGSVGLVWGSSANVNTAQTASSPTPQVILHELFHTVGAVSPCAPHHSFLGHVADDNDLMNATLNLSELGLTSLDVGRDDYWGQGNSTCDGDPYPDLSLSAVFD